ATVLVCDLDSVARVDRDVLEAGIEQRTLGGPDRAAVGWSGRLGALRATLGSAHEARPCRRDQQRDAGARMSDRSRQGLRLLPLAADVIQGCSFDGRRGRPGRMFRPESSPTAPGLVRGIWRFRPPFQM